ncbi:PKD domain-containing protein [Cellulomonas aerilata]|uniref:PDK repeat-containing protein n=1 Tax=Cellulomonas aerilata TaxID=515326 RepID=A0A512DDT7_9CELL|nr:PKD domain-containing protein [Cellulomonas aerilata]GEO34641.1 hypothetical protein CAE01nite_23660 [Cellulomonas aerilata]
MRPDLNRLARRATATVGVLSMALVGMVVSPAAADTAPAVEAGLPQTVSSDSLPTAQIDGIAWDQKIAGNTVYVGGRFTSVRPAGAAPGASTVARSNMMAYDIRTGQHTGFAPTFNGQVRQLAVSPDGTRVYAAGEFTTVNGTTMYRVAAFNAATGALITSFRPAVNARIASIAVTNTTVYIGGIFSSVNNQPRARVAAINAANGAVLPAVGSADDGAVNALVVSPDGSKLVVGGSFTTFNASSKPGYGLAMVDTASGQMLPLPANDLIRNGGANASITSLSSDADTFYGSGYVYGAGGNLEGAFAARWSDGGIAWVEDCHGDTYQSKPIGGVLYSASHKHYCGNVGGFPETTPRSFYRATATTIDARRTVTKEPTGSYYNYAGTPAPELLNWFPAMDTGTFSGSNQGPWAVDGTGQYVVMSGEFTRVNNVGQQGLARFAVPSIAPNRDGPRLSGATINPRLRSVTPGEVRMTWPANWDRDNATLTYRVYRTSSTTPPIFEQTVTASFWETEDLQFVDTGLEPGSTQRYRVTATDPYNNTVQSEFVTVTVASAQTANAYAGEVLADGASSYWRLDEVSGTTVQDWAGRNDAVAAAGVTRGAAGAVPGTASTFDGTTSGWAASQKAAPGPNTFTVEAWFSTTSTTGGKIVGYGSSATAPSGSYDRQVYMDNAGRIVFGVHPGTNRTVVSTGSFNDGQWHHVAASLGSNGMRLYVDGKIVGQRTDTTSGQAYNGYWRIGGDTIGVSWTNSPTSKYLAGAIDDVAVYPTVLVQEQLLDHYLVSGRTSTLPVKPSDAYGAAVRDAGPELYWRLGETEGTQAVDTGLAGLHGTYRSGVTLGAAGPLASGATTAVTLDGVDDYVSGDTSVVNPRVYSQELWFSTTTTRGGRLIGFGTSKDAVSTSYDRTVYMETDGRLSFGALTSVKNVISSTAPYNDGAWHHLVATQSSEGMRLYVDGVLVAQNAVTGAQSYTGYWRVGADRNWGPSQGFDGKVDEAAIYSRALGAQTVADHFALGTTGGPADGLPTAAFTSAVDALGVTVDGTASSDPEGGALTFAWEFGDGATGTGPTAAHTYAVDGTYTVRLTVTDAAGGTDTEQATVKVAAPANVAPTAAFTPGVRNLVVDLDARASADSDGTIASYDWSFGDGTTGTGATTSHTYSAAGTFTVGLTVTDDDGARTQTSQQVTVAPAPPANVAPTASFTSSAQGLALSVNGSGSSDPDGTVASYAWAFGDGGTATGPTASWTYAEPGTYTVVLTVTDDDGGKGTKSATVTVTAPPAPPTPPASTAVAQDAFGRTVANGWGTAEVGGAWTTTGSASLFSVDGSVGRQRLATAGADLKASLNGATSTDTELQAQMSLDKPTTGGGVYFSVVGRQVGSEDYKARLRIYPTGKVDLTLARTGTTLGAVTVPVTYTAGDALQVRLQVTGTAPTTIRAKVWKVGESEPADWQRTVTDATAGLQVAGGIGLGAYLSGSSTNAPTVASFDRVWAGPTAGAPVAGA